MRRQQDSYNILNSLGEALIITDSKAKITMLNPSAENLTGYNESDIIGKSVETIFHLPESDISAFQAGMYEDVFKYGKIQWNSDKPMLLIGKGKVIPVAGNAAIISDTAGNTEGIALLLRGISTAGEGVGNSSVEEKLRTLNIRYETLLAAIPEIIMEVDSNKVYCWGNQAGIEFFGNDVLGHEAAFYFEGEQETYNVIDSLYQGNDNTVYVESWQRRKDGRKRLLAWWCRSLKNQTGEVIGALSSARDITEIKHAEKNLRDSEKKYRDLINSMNDAIYVIDYDMSIVDVNNAAISVLGYSRDELMSMIIPDIDVNLSPGQIQNLANHMPADKLQVFETEHLTKEGKKIPVEVSSSLVSYSGRTLILSIARDITDRKLAESELIRAKEHAEESDRLKSAFLANMSHEIRTPMNGILGFTHLLGEADLSEADKAEYIGIIKMSGERMLNTINDLIEISRIETGIISVIETETNINDLLHFLYTFFELQSNQKGLKLFCKTDLTDDRAIVITDRHKLDRVMINLIRNAIKFTNTGSVEFGYKAEKNILEFYVTDTGIGIRADRCEAVFERFVQADLDHTRSHEGSGLGLAISKAYVEMLGGSIRLESEPGKGSTFRFTIPWTKKDNEWPETRPEQLAFHDGILSDRIILIAEDDETNYYYLERILAPVSGSVIRVTNGQEAVNLCLNDKNISLVLMDIKMPGLDGYEALRLIRELRKDLIIIAQTAFALKGEREKALSAGFNDYISKPFDSKKLLEMISMNIRRVDSGS